MVLYLATVLEMNLKKKYAVACLISEPKTTIIGMDPWGQRKIHNRKHQNIPQTPMKMNNIKW